MKYNIFGYLIGEGFGNVFKNKKSTGASLMIMCATMIIFGIFLILGENINHFVDQIKSEQGFQVFLNTDATEEEIVERIENRRVCPECKAVYNLKLNPPSQEGICDKCGHELVQRKDDNVDTIKSRIKTYIDVTSPLIEYYEKKEKLYTAEVSERINRLGSDVAKDVIELLKK